jgi:hypothetical protein
MFIKKLRGRIRLCINYYKLNIIIKKDKYLILLIKETITRIIGCKIITKLDIRKAFNRIRISTLEDEDLLLFCTPISNFKPKVLLFRPTNRLVSF